MKFIALLALAATVHAENVVFPPDAVVDLTKPPYSITGDGKTDCTAGINKALTDYSKGSDTTLYFPPGIYVVSDTLALQGSQKRTVFQGAGRDHTTIRLKDACPGFTDPAKAKPVFYFGRDPAQRFRNHMFDLTVNTGSGNSGAIGVQYYTSNQGALMRVNIISGDGAGVTGLDTGYQKEIGPGLVRDLKVSGFNVGVSSKALNSMTMEYLTLENQKEVGLFNRGCMLAVRGLISRNTAPAVKNAGVLTLVDAVLAGGKGGEAIVNTGSLFARNIRQTGYGRAIQNDWKGKTATPLPTPSVDGAEVKEFVSRPAAGRGAGPYASLNLPVKDSPSVPWDPAEKWASPLAFGAVGDGKADDTAAIQKAIDSGATTVYLPRYRDGKPFAFMIAGDLFLRGKLRRFTGCDGALNGSGRIIAGDGDGPLVFERCDLIYRKIGFVHRSARPVALSNITMGKAPIESEGRGDFFLDDVCTGELLLNQPGQPVWIRQLNTESRGTNVVSRGAQLWILGHKTERGGIKINAMGGSVELLGAFAYCTTKAPKETFIRAVDAEVTIAGFTQVAFGNPLYEAFIMGTKRGVPFSYTRKEGSGLFYDAADKAAGK
jgi:hypothetical protein